ncbi:MAG: penicillin-binding protein [Bryobacteraceae bacterium]
MADAHESIPEVRRLRRVARVALLWAAVIFTRLAYLQIFHHAEMVKLANRQQTREEEIPALRATIYSRGGDALALSKPVYSFGVNVKKLPSPGIAFDVIAETLHVEAAELHRLYDKAKANGKATFWLKRKLEESEAKSILAYKWEWAELQRSSKRVYPQGRTAGHLVGWTSDDKGLAGIEMSQDSKLRGVPGKLRVYTDVNGRVIGQQRLIKAPQQGTDIGLTIDAPLQFYCDRRIEQAVSDNHCQSGTIVVMDPNNGDVLAMSAYPGFDPAAPTKERNGHPAVAEARDPGSVMKVFTAAAAFEHTRLTAKSWIPGGNGLFRYGKGDAVIHDTHSFSGLRLEEAIWHSSNICAINIGITVGKDNLTSVFSSLGFGKKTGIPLPGEHSGILKTPEHPRWRKSTLFYMAFGHEMTATTLQMARAASAIANGGYLVQPRLVEWTQQDNGDRRKEPYASKVRVLSGDTATEIRRITEGVMLYGTGKGAKLAEYTGGGKTGTAQMFEGKKYGHRYASSFMGYSPLQVPKVVVVVTLNGTRKLAGDSAAPVYKDVALRALRAVAQEPDVPRKDGAPVEADEVEDAVEVPMETAPRVVEEEETPARVTEIATGAKVPDFRGKAKDEVIRATTEMGIPVQLTGLGLARRQDPAPGSPMVRGLKLKVHFAQ